MIGHSKLTPIGLDLCSRALHAVQLQREEGLWHLTGWISLDRPTDSEVAQQEDITQLASLAQEQGFRGHIAALCLPTNKHFSSLMDIPAISSGAPIGEITKVELCREVNKPVEQCETAWWPLPRAGRVNESDRAMVVGCQIADADEVLDPIEQAGLTVSILDLRAAALLRACRSLIPQGDQITPLLEIGHTCGLITIAVGHTLVYHRRVELASVHSMHRLLMTQLAVESDIADHLLFEVGLAGPDPEPPIARLPEVRDLMQSIIDRIAEEVRSSISFTTHKYSKSDVMPLLVCGDGGSIPGLCSVLSRMLATDCQVITPQAILGTDCHLTDPSMIAAIGVAMHGAAA